MARRRSPAKTKYPSFAGLKPASQASTRSKKANRSQGTKHEVTLQRALRQLGLHFNRNVKRLPGNPDIVFPTEKVVVFCDGDFWHGRDWSHLSRKLRRVHNSSYWKAKIQCNKRRDRIISHKLKSEGWRVMRVWEGEIKKSAESVADEICQSIRGTNGHQH
jgi:DNA mismatch endonuclease (patch repair protein)